MNDDPLDSRVHVCAIHLPQMVISNGNANVSSLVDIHSATNEALLCIVYDRIKYEHTDSARRTWKLSGRPSLDPYEGFLDVFICS